MDVRRYGEVMGHGYGGIYDVERAFYESSHVRGLIAIGLTAIKPLFWTPAEVLAAEQSLIDATEERFREFDEIRRYGPLSEDALMAG